MLYARSNGRKIKASPGETGICPECDNRVVTKCGEIRIWHWAHRAHFDWPMNKGETDWHLAWKDLMEPDWTEVKVGGRRADIIAWGEKGLTVIELQHSSISIGEIRDR